MPDAEDLTIDGGQASAGDSQPDAVRQFTARFRQAATISNATGSARAALRAAGVRGLRVHGYSITTQTASWPMLHGQPWVGNTVRAWAATAAKQYRASEWLL